MHVGNEPVEASNTGGAGDGVTTATPGGSGASGAVGTDGGSPATDASCHADLFLDRQAQTDIIENSCSAAILVAASNPIQLGLVLDVSSSNLVPPTHLYANNWAATMVALDSLLSSSGLGLSDDAQVGMLLFPNQVNDAPIPISPTEVSACVNVAAMMPMEALGPAGNDTHRTLLLQKYKEAVVAGGTPTEDAYNYALFNMMLTADPTTDSKSRILLLITDGQPSYSKGCYNPSGELQDLPGDPILASVQHARDLGIKTYVIGAPGSEAARPWLSKAAYIGGLARADCEPDSPIGPYCHSDLTQTGLYSAEAYAAALAASFGTLLFPMATCRFRFATALPGFPPLELDINRISPVLMAPPTDEQRLMGYPQASYLLPNNTQAGVDCGSGYRIIDATQIELGRATCQKLYSGQSVLEAGQACDHQ
ncbi:MAG TPA: vWA domain-containing protein [Polyangiaceae bacterium]